MSVFTEVGFKQETRKRVQEDRNGTPVSSFLYIHMDVNDNKDRCLGIGCGMSVSKVESST